MMHIDELEILAGWLRQGQEAAVATVISTWGSAPRPIGSLLVIRADGVFEGSVSGGCVEAAVIEQALAAIGDGRTRDLSFGVSNETAFSLGLACGGTIRVHIDPCTPVGALDHALRLRAARKPFTRMFALDTPGWSLREDAEETGRLDGDVFHHVIAPQPRLIIFGAVHIAQFLASIADMAGYEVIVVDPRQAYATAERFAGIRLLAAWPAEALAELAPDYRTAIVLLTHDVKLDDPALAGALATPAFYIAALGSRRTHAARRERLAAAGFDEAALKRIHGPAGIAIGALSPAEIAVSIMAELTAAYRGRTLDADAHLTNPRRVGPRVSAIVLAAGLSSRMAPRNKLLLDHGGQTMIRKVVETITSAGPHEVIVVTGHMSQDITEALAGTNVRFVHNHDYSNGMGSSIAFGVRAVMPGSDAVLVCLGDMPDISPATIQALFAAYDPAGNVAICVPAYQGISGHPVLFDRMFLSSLGRLEGDSGAKSLLAAWADRVREVDTDDAGILLDIDHL